MMALPAPTIVTAPADDTVATAVLPLVYVHRPELVDVGSVNENPASPNVFAGTVNAPTTGTIFATVNVAVIDFALYNVVAA